MNIRNILEIIIGIIIIASLFLIPRLITDYSIKHEPELYDKEPTVSIGTPPASESHFETYGY